MTRHTLVTTAMLCVLSVSVSSFSAESATAPVVAPQTVLLDEGADPGTWRINPGSEFPGATGEVSLGNDAGRPCLKLDVDFTGGGRYCGIDKAITLPSATHVSFSAKALGATGGMIRLRDATNQEHAGSFRLKPDEWQEVSLPLTRQAFGGFWSGANDGEFYFPLRVILIALNGPANKTSSCLIRDITVTTTDSSQFWDADVETNRPGNILFREDTDNRAWLAVRNRTGIEQNATLTWTVTDHTGQVTDEGRTVLPFSKWQIRTLPLKIVDPVLPGYYYVKGTIETPDGLVIGKEGGIGVVACPANLGQPDPTCFFGIHASNIDQVARIGAKWLRPGRTWRWGEMRKGEYLWPDEPVKGAKEYNCHIMMTLHYDPPTWARNEVEGQALWPPPKALLDGWAAYVTACVKQYDDAVDAWEIQNEPDLTCFHHVDISFEEGVKSYVDIFRTAHAAIRAAGSKHPIAGIDVSGGDYRRDLAFSRAVMAEISDILDIYTGHPYASPRYFGEGKKPLFPHQNKLIEKIELSRGMCDQYGGRPLWIGEKGWGLHISESLASPSSYAYASCTAQALATGHSVKGVEHWFWFLERGCNEHGHEYGLWRVSPDQPLPAAVAYATSAAQLRHVEPVRRLKLSDDLRGFAFRAKDTAEGVVAVWSVADDFRVPADALSGSVNAVDCFGRAVPRDACVLTSAPTYLRTPQANLEPLCTALENADIAPSHPVAVEGVFRSSRDLLAIRLRNKTTFPQTVAVTGTGVTREIALEGLASVETDLPIPRDLPSGTHLRIALGKQVLFEAPIPAAPSPCPKFGSMPALQPDAWGAPVAVLADREDILPPDPNIGWHGLDDLSMKVWLNWSEAGLRVAVDVTDDIHNVPSAGPGSFWKSDSIQIAVDPQNDTTGDDGFDDDDREFGLVIGPEGPAVFQTAPGQAAVCSEATVDGKRTDARTLYQVLLPWSLLGRQPKSGDVFAVNVIANDNDGHGREYWMGMTPGIGEGKRPSVYREFFLAE